MSETPPRDAFEALVEQAQREHADYRPADVAVDRLWQVVARDDAASARRAWTIRALLGLPLAAAAINVAEPQLLPTRTVAALSHVDVLAVVALPATAVFVSLVLLGARTAGAQMLLRALLWSTAVLGALVNITDPHVVPITALAANLACCGALLALRDHGLEPERYRGSFAPIAHHGVLTLMMILAVADAQTLVSWSSGMRWRDVAPGLCGLAMIAGIVGLYRLQLWGLLCNLVLSVAVAGLALTRVLDLPPVVVAMLCTTASLQVVLAAVVLRSIRRGAPAELPHWARWGRYLVWGAIVGVMLVGVVVFVVDPAPHCEQQLD
ncbi:MAG: hypothetical protein IPH07_18905 [Deltaproteobacteria bacterium]|nr:hypothetical protein [Deltaproteobacteria bacterium]MBK8238897.1 hypothetical protein [Deltaproteobacteria bacterium]MBP7288149.1 hypothetical protein [Nannocystaceae bacterium]